MKVFVAGASGAIGQPLITELIRKGHTKGAKRNGRLFILRTRRTQRWQLSRRIRVNMLSWTTILRP
jgi:nucleoside-diphosphate-sugar epimerase